jgi:transglutaminase-like putative cysteine protease
VNVTRFEGDAVFKERRMIIRAGYRIAYQCQTATPMLLMLNVHPSREKDLVTPDAIRSTPNAPMQTYLDAFGNRVTRVEAPPGLVTFSTDFAMRDSGRPDESPRDRPLTPVKDLPNEALVFLMPSRYCDSDSLSDLAWAQFHGIGGGARLVQTICDFAHDRIRFDYGLASPFRMASDALREGVGVCRDFTHLAVALCRAMNVPARYCTGYLGDIGVPPDPAPMDFSAWFEALLDGNWYAFDARHNMPRIGRIVMARGRDAADVAISTAFGQAPLARFEVTTYEETHARVAV